MLSDFQFLV